MQRRDERARGDRAPLESRTNTSGRPGERAVWSTRCLCRESSEMPGLHAAGIRNNHRQSTRDMNEAVRVREVGVTELDRHKLRSRM